MAIPAELIHLVGEFLAIRFSVPTKEGENFESSGLHAFFCVDKSGSMAGSPIKDTKGALISLIQKFQKVQVPITAYLFSNKLQEISSENEGYASMLVEADNLKAAGGTLFGPVIESMQGKIKEKNLKNVFAVWLTDGQDNKGLNPLIEKMNLFHEDMENDGVSIAVHTIGFSPDHDAALLTKLSQSGTRPGSFQYVPPGGRIPVAVNNVYELAFVSTTWARIIAPERVYKIEIEKEEEKLRGLVYMSENDLEDCKVEIHRGENIELYNLDTYRSEAKDFKELVLLVTNFISSKIIQVLEASGERAVHQLKEMRPLIEEMDRRIEGLIQEGKKFRAFFRKQLQPFFSATKDLLLQYYQTLRDNSGAQLSNIQLASLNNLAHKNSLKRNLEKKIMREFGRNLDLLNESEKKIEEIVKNLNTADLKAKYADSIEKYGECLLTTRNWLEALSDGDCFCFTFHLERPQNLLGDPLEIKIKKLNTTVISCDSFVDSALFETKAGQIIQGGRNYQHGENPLPAASLVKGLPDEIINGVLPVYINQDHWQIARLRVRQMVAWDITVDVLGFIPVQLHVFPFAVLVKALEDSETEFSKFQCQILKETCLAIYNDSRDFMACNTKKHFSKHIDKPSHRLPKHIPSNSIFVCQLWAASMMGDVDKPELIFPFIFEEEVRRRMDTKKEITFQEFAVKLLGIEKTHYADLVKHTLTATDSKYSKIFQDLRSKEHITPTCDTNTPDNVETTKRQQVKFEINEIPDLSILTPRAQGFIDRIEKSMAKSGVLNRILSSFTVFEHTFRYTSLESIGLITNEQKLCLILQSYRDKRNQDRKEIIRSGKYYNIFNPEEAAKSIKEIYIAAITREALSYKASLANEMKNGATKEVALQFGLTSDLEKAAGCLYGVKQGSADFCLFYKQLMLPTSLYVCQKLKMMTHGHFMGIKLIMDDIKGKPFVSWCPNTKVINKIWKVHENDTDKSQWIDAIPSKHEYFEHKYMRKDGIFVPYSKPRANVVDKRHWEGKVKKTAASSGKNLKRGKRGKTAARGRK